jgi:Flp pilus assembly protein TadG
MLKFFRQTRNSEEGNSIVMFLITFPIIVAIFGLIVDGLLLAYAKSEVQSAADSAALVIASSKQLGFSFSEAKAKTVYQANLEQAKQVLQCKDAPYGCGSDLGFQSSSTKACASVTERVNFLFLDSLPFAIFGSSGDALKKSVDSLSEIRIDFPNGFNSSTFNKAQKYACAIIK